MKHISLSSKIALITLICLLFMPAYGFVVAKGGDSSGINGKIAFESDRDGNVEIYTMNPDGSGLSRLTNNADAYDGELSWSPDGTQIAFVSDRDGNDEIYIMNADGSGQHRVTNNAASEGNPDWSPDGTKIAFTSDRDGNDEIYVMDADGSGQTRLTNNIQVDGAPAWSPDGTKIAFDSDRDGSGEIYVMNADGSGQTRLTNNYAEDWNPNWSPDGSKITWDTNLNGNYEIYVMNANGSAQTRLTNNPTDDGYPDWSPDGTKIVFDSNRDGYYQLYTMNTDGSGVTRLTSASSDNWSPLWATLPPSSNEPTINGKITFQSNRDGNWEIYVMNADGSGQTRLTNNAFADEWPSWSPDGTRIAFSSNREGGNMEIWVMNANGTGATQLTFNSGHDYQPCWSPDGTRIAFASTRDGNYEIYVMNSDGTGEARLTNNVYDDDLPRWSPDGNKIAFESERPGQWEIYLMNPDGSAQTRLTTNSNENPCWSPNGTKMMFTTPHGSIEELWVMNANGSGQARVTYSSARDYLPYWSPDGTKVAFISTRDGNDEIYVMNADGSGQTRLTNNGYDDYFPSWQSLSLTHFQQTGIGSDFSGNLLSVDGANYMVGQLPASLAWTPGTSHNFSWSSPLAVSSDKRYIWHSTSGLSTEQAGAITPAAGDDSLAASYKAQYYVAFMNATGGSLNKQSGWYDASSTISVIAIASSGYFANGWEMSGGIQFISGSDENMIIRVDGPGSVTPLFELADLVPPTITIISPANGSTTTTASVTISASYSDNVAVNLSSVVLRVNGNNVTPNATVTATGITWSTSFATGTYSIELTVEDASGNPQTATWSFTVEQPAKSGCFIATATYGSEAAPQVQALRDFRDSIAMKTFAGSSFMYGFLTWYYSWSPPVADAIAPSDSARAVMRIALQPLINILQVASATFSALSFSWEFAIVVAGFVSAALIGLIYIVPSATLVLLVSKRLKKDLVLPSASRVLQYTTIPWLVSVALIAIAELASAPLLMALATAAFVILTIVLTVGTTSFWLAGLVRKGE